MASASAITSSSSNVTPHTQRGGATRKIPRSHSF
jgi:hypothetical protein